MNLTPYLLHTPEQRNSLGGPSPIIPPNVVYYDNEMPLSYGRGYNRLTGRTIGTALDTSGGTDSPVGDGLITVFAINLVEDYSELRESLSISTAASFNAGAAGAHGRAELVSTRAVNSYSVFLLIRVVVRSQLQALKVYKFADKEIIDLFKHDQLEFYRRFGTEFISGIATGGEFYALFEFSTGSEFERRAITAKLGGSYGVWSGSAEFAQSLETLRRFKRINARFARWGTSEPLPDPTNVDSIIHYALTFPTKLAPRPGTNPGVSILLTTETYNAVTNRPENYTIDFSREFDVINDIANSCDRLDLLKQDNIFATKHPSYFQASDIAQADKKIARIDKYKEELVLDVRGIQADPKNYKPKSKPDWSTVSPSPPYKSGTAVPIRLDYDYIPSPGLGLGVRPGPPVRDAEWTVASLSIVDFNIILLDSIGDLSAEYMAHLADLGNTGWYASGTKTYLRSHQGFAVRLTGLLSEFFNVSYQARLVGGIETGVCANGQYCGTMGQFRPMTAMRVWISAK